MLFESTVDKRDIPLFRLGIRPVLSNRKIVTFDILNLHLRDATCVSPQSDRPHTIKSSSLNENPSIIPLPGETISNFGCRVLELEDKPK